MLVTENVKDVHVMDILIVVTWCVNVAMVMEVIERNVYKDY